MSDDSAIVRSAGEGSAAGNSKIAAAGGLAALREVLLKTAQQEIDSLRQRVEMLETRAGGGLGAWPRGEAKALNAAPSLHSNHEATLGEGGMHPSHPPTTHVIPQARNVETKGWFTKFGRAASGTLAHFGKKEDEILDLVLIHRPTWSVIDRQSRACDAALAASIAGTLECLQGYLRDETILAHYERRECIHVEDLTYGIHVAPLALLMSVIRGRHPAAALAVCKSALTCLHATHTVALGDYDPVHLPMGLLPPEMVG